MQTPEEKAALEQELSHLLFEETQRPLERWERQRKANIRIALRGVAPEQARKSARKPAQDSAARQGLRALRLELQAAGAWDEEAARIWHQLDPHA